MTPRSDSDLVRAVIGDSGPTELALHTRDDLRMAISLERIAEEVIPVEQEERLPNLLLISTANAKAAWMYTARVLAEIRDTDVWERVEDGKYKGNWKDFLSHYTASAEFTVSWAGKVLMYRDWIVKHMPQIREAKPSEPEYESAEPQIPRMTTMQFIIQYHEAFERNQELLRAVFWREEYDHTTLRAEIRAKEGDAYIASKEPEAFRSRSLGGSANIGINSTAPTFGPPSQRSDLNPIHEAAVTLTGRLYDMLVNNDVYAQLGPNEKRSVRANMQGTIAHILETDGDIKKS